MLFSPPSDSQVNNNSWIQVLQTLQLERIRFILKDKLGILRKFVKPLRPK